MRFIAGVLLPLFALDQVTKWLVTQHLVFGEERPVVPGFFSWVYWGNTGAAFSMMSGKSWFFIGLAFITLTAMAVAAVLGKIPTNLQKFTWSLLAAGILGNLSDRLTRGHVVDFLLFYLHIPMANPWPAFNVADSCICVAAALLIWQSFSSDKKSYSSKT